jgi:hypothetical protein
MTKPIPAVIKSVGQRGRCQLKAAEDSRTPGHYREVVRPTSARFWSAAPWSLRHPDSVYRDCRFTLLRHARLSKTHPHFPHRFNVLTLLTF